MRKINIQTTQNVVIENSLAGAGLRAGASLLDIIVLTIYCFFCLAITSALVTSGFEGNFIAFWFLFMPVFLFYSPFCEIVFSGRTLGKLIVGIRVVQLNGENLTPQQAVMRWVFRVVDLWICFGSLAVIFSSASEKGQRIGDTLAETLVVRDRVTTYNINDILKIKSNDNFSPEYSGITKYTDEDMLWLKQVLKRTKENPSKANKNLVLKISKKIQQELGLGKEPKNSEEFLNKVLEDYIVLTRS